MTATATLLVIAAFSRLAIRVATMALVMTVLSSDTASFQCYSAFFGVGFTTREAELVVIRTTLLFRSFPWPTEFDSYDI